MPNFILAYMGRGMPENPEEGAKKRENFMAWISSLGDAVVNPGTPLGMSRTVSSGGVSEGGGSNFMSGFSIVKAESLDAAVEIARGSPYLEMGTIEVAEVMEMK